MKNKKEENIEQVEDIEFVEENEKVSTFGMGNKEQKLKEKIKVLESEKAEYLDGWQRARAEMANLKKNHNEEKKLFTNLGKESMVLEIIPALDNFDAAFSNKAAWEKVDSAWRSGVEYIYSQFVQVLENNGVVQFGNIGDNFDESLHLSLENIENADEKQDGKISEVLQKGYKSGDKIIREAKVKVFKK